MKSVIWFLLVLFFGLFKPYTVLADQNLAITDYTPARYADYPFVFPFNGKKEVGTIWDMPSSGTTNFGSLNHALKGSHHTGEDWLVKNNQGKTDSNLTGHKPIYSINHGVVVYSKLYPGGQLGYLVIVKHVAKPG